MKINGILSKGTTLAYEENGVLVTVSGVKSVPIMGSEPVKVDTTNMLSQKNEYKMGRQDVDTLEFGIIYKGANLDAIDKLVKANQERNWVVTYPDGLTAKFTGKISYKMEAVEVNNAIAFNVAIVVSNGPIITPAPIPTRPENVVASNVTYESFTLSWEGTGRFRVYVDDAVKGETVINNFKVTGLDDNKRYKVVVASVGPNSEELSYPVYVQTELFILDNPTNVTLEKLTDSIASFVWEHSVAEKYKVVLNDKTHEIKSKSYTFSGLSEDTSYTFKVAAYAKNRWSDFTEPYTFKTLRSRPNAVTGLRTTNITDDSISIEWQHFDDQFENIYYDIYLDSHKVSSTQDKNYVFDNLSEKTEYSIYVVANSNGVISDKTDTLVVKTKEFTVEVPANVSISSIKPTSAVAKWESSLIRFKVYLDGKEYKETTDKQLTITGLTPKTAYRLQAKAFDKNKWSELTDAKSFVTQSVETPTDLFVKDINMNNAIVSWNGSTEHYKVFLNGTLQATVESPIYKLEGLKKNTNYTVKVLGVYDGYESDPVETSFKTPNLPVPHSLKITNVTYKGATLSWLGNSDSYKVYVYDVLYKETENNTLDLELEPNTEYVITVSGIYESEEGEKSESITLTTKGVPAITDLKVLAAGTNYLEFGWAGETGKYEVTFDDNVITQAETVYKATGLSQGKTYSIKVRSVYNNSYSEYVELSAKTSTIAMPTDLAVSDVTYRGAKVSWTGDFEEYNVYLNDNLVKKVASKTYAFDGLKPNEKYNVSIQSVKDNDTSEKTTPIEFTTSVVPVVSDLKVTSVGYDFIEISWNGLGSYVLDVNGEQIKTTDNVYRKADLKQSETATFKVANVYKDVISDYSTAQATTNKVAEVTGLQVTDKSYKSISLKWSTNYKKAIVIYNDNKTETVNNTIKLDDLIPQTEYTISVVAVDEDFESEKVSVVATTDIVPVPKFTLDSSNNEITVKITEIPTGKVEIWLDENNKNIISNSAHKFTNLESGKEYTVNLSSVYKDYRSVVVSQKIKTKTAVPPKINVTKIGISYVDFEIIGTQNDYRVVVDGVTDYLTTDKSHRITELNANTSYTIKAYQRFDGIWSEHVSETVKTGEITEDSYIIDIYPDAFEREHEWFNSRMLEVAQGKKAEGIDASGTPKKPNITDVEELTVHDFSLVTQIRLVENNLTGEMPSSFGNLNNLRSLYLQRNNLTGEIPSSVENLSNSNYFNFSSNNLNIKGNVNPNRQFNFNSKYPKKITIPEILPNINYQYKLSELVGIRLERSLEETTGLPVTVEINGVKYIDRKLRYEDPLITGIPTDKEQKFRIWVYDGDVVKNGMYIEYSISNNLRMSRMATLPPVEEVIKDMPTSLNEQQRKIYITNKLSEYQTNNNNIQE